MTQIVAGIDFAHEHLTKLLGDVEYYDRLSQDVISVALNAENFGIQVSRPHEESEQTPHKVRRVKIAHVDFAWDLEHDLMPEDVLFGSEESALINKRRMEGGEEGVDPLHGTTCAAAIRMNDASRKPNSRWPLDAEEDKLWNLADFAEVILVPVRDPIDPIELEIKKAVVREFCEINSYPDAFRKRLLGSLEPTGEHEFRQAAQRICASMMPDYENSTRICGALNEIMDLERSGLLEKGDIVLITMQNVLGDNETHLPIIHSPMIEKAIHELSLRGLAVIIPAGNSGTNLDALEAPRMGSKIHANQEIPDKEFFRNHGVRCGAIIVGAAKDNPNQIQINHGSCVDVFGRCNITVPDTSHPPYDNSIYKHWLGSSIAATVTACILACIQQIRFASQEHILPLKPYEARAHLRQWRNFDFEGFACAADLAGPPPNIQDWLTGTGMDVHL